MGFDTSEVVNEIAVWLALIKLHIDEAYLGNKKSETWLFSEKDDKDFELICDLARLNKGYVRRKIRERFSNARIKRRIRIKKRAIIKINKIRKN